LFLGWHRPYLALFEVSVLSPEPPRFLQELDKTKTKQAQQVLSEHVLNIARKAPADQMERYLTAANEFRIPYWDWAQGTTAGPVPDIFTAPYLTIIDTDRTPVVISNPLYSYTFDPVPEGFDMKVS
jgi:tyrosinase